MRILMLLALAMHLMLSCAAAQAAASPAAVRLGAAGNFDLVPQAVLLRDDGGAFPAGGGEAAFGAWMAAHARAKSVASGGGAYWLVAVVRNDTALAQWVQQAVTGYRASHEYMLHCDSDVRLQPQRSYRLVMRFNSPYYVRTPIVALRPQGAFRLLAARENVEILGALGALGALALYNFFIYSFTRRSAYLYYSLFVISTALAWAMPFNVFVDLFGWYLEPVHYVPFFLMPVFSTLFYLRFLELKTRAPLLAKISRINIVLPLLLLPTSFLAIGVAHKLVTVVIAFYMVLALISGIVAWRRGFQPARYFVLAYIAVLAPALMVLPANMGLLPPIDANVPLLVLVGGTVDALMLAFALADEIRLLSGRMEQQVATRTDDLVRANTALTAAKEHAEVVSRHRIDFLSAMR